MSFVLPTALFTPNCLPHGPLNLAIKSAMMPWLIAQYDAYHRTLGKCLTCKGGYQYDKLNTKEIKKIKE